MESMLKHQDDNTGCCERQKGDHAAVPNLKSFVSAPVLDKVEEKITQFGIVRR
ncbi:hypothetical protein RUM44_008770, partial [Polyplax serrata]